MVHKAMRLSKLEGVKSYDLDAKRPRSWPSLAEFEAEADPCENCGPPVVTLTVTITWKGTDRARTNVYEFGPADDPDLDVKLWPHVPESCRAARRGAG